MLYLPTMYLYRVLFCNLKMSKATAKLSKRSRNKSRYNRFQLCPLPLPRLNVTISYRRSTCFEYQHIYIVVSDSIYMLSCQCNWTTQIEPAHDNYVYLLFYFIHV